MSLIFKTNMQDKLVSWGIYRTKKTYAREVLEHRLWEPASLGYVPDLNNIV